METLEHNDTPAASASRWSGLGVRIASAVALATLFLASLWHGGWLFDWLVLLAALMMIREWNGLTERDESHIRLLGLLYVSIPCASLLWLRGVELPENPQAGLNAVLFVMTSVWATDIGAYFVGRQFGQRPLAPTISPKKTWEGLGGGVFAAAIAAQLCELAFPLDISLGAALLCGVVLAVVGQGGDLLESWMKRRAGVKDSGTLIPGHGGLLDRVDGLVPTLPLFALILYCLVPLV